MSKVPAGLIIDDGAPVNSLFFCDFAHSHELLIPSAFTKKFALSCRKHGIKGKYSVIPMPQGLGRVDRSLNMLKPSALRAFLRIVRELIQPSFSITPEILTHFRAYDRRTDTYRHVFEDTYINGLSAEEIADYVGFALEILVGAGLNPTGITSPWMTGESNEKNYAAGIGMAFKRVLKRDRCFYFLHFEEAGKPVIMCDTPETGRVVSIPANTHDPFWLSQNPATAKQGVSNVREKLDVLLSPDGRTGTLRKLFEAGVPMTICTHWQSLFSDGRETGLEGLCELAARMKRAFGNGFEWLSFEELSHLAVPRRRKQK